MKLGEKIKVNVVEEITDSVFIVNFHGKLMRVKNTSAKKINKNQIVELKVVALKPLVFKLNTPQFRSMSIDV